MPDEKQTARITTEKPAELRGFPTWAALTALLAVTLLMFGDLLFGGPVLLSSAGTDLFLQDLHWRAFGFGHLRQGHVALWNPHIFCGTPFFGTFQSTLFYPVNLPYLFLPLHAAINFGIALHVFLAGVFMYLWTRHRGLHPLACVMAGVLFMFCGPHFLHVYAGHLGRLGAIIWTPLIFLAIDGWLERRTLNWALLGAFAVAMQIMAGDPQYVFYTGVAALLYLGLCLWRAPKRLIALAGFASIFIGGVALSGVQVFAGLDALRGSIRSDAVPWHFAIKFAFPPENLLTLVAPGFFGGLSDMTQYWGRCYLWEMSLFFSVTGLALAVYGACAGERKTRRFAVTMAVLLFVLALGVHTPLFRLLYLAVPGFNKFRGISKFSLQMVCFLILLSAIGLDALIRNREGWRRLALGALIGAGVLLLGALAIHVSASRAPQGLWQRALQKIPPPLINVPGPDGVVRQQPDPLAEAVYAPREIYQNVGHTLKAGREASGSLVVAAITLLLVAGTAALRKRGPKAAYALAGLAVLEMLLYGMITRATTDPGTVRMPGIEQLAKSHPGDYRVLNLPYPNLAMSLGMYDVRGYAPLLSGRYAEFAAFLQGQDPNKATQYVMPLRESPLRDLLRLRYVILPREGTIGPNEPWYTIQERPRPLARLNLIYRYRVAPRRDDAFAIMGGPEFDPHTEVVLEKPPMPPPGRPDPSAAVRLVAETTDSLTVEAKLAEPAILLITDTWYPGWRVTPLMPGPQSVYQLVPADYAFRGIPLAAGSHLLRIEYAPPAFRAGAVVSLVSLTVFVGLLGWTALRRRWSRAGRNP